jgi:hypothetical protein
VERKGRVLLAIIAVVATYVAHVKETEKTGGDVGQTPLFR